MSLGLRPPHSKTRPWKPQRPRHFLRVYRLGLHGLLPGFVYAEVIQGSTARLAGSGRRSWRRNEDNSQVDSRGCPDHAPTVLLPRSTPQKPEAIVEAKCGAVVAYSATAFGCASIFSPRYISPPPAHANRALRRQAAWLIAWSSQSAEEGLNEGREAISVASSLVLSVL